MSKKPNESLTIPSTIEDYQALLDNTSVVNGRGYGIIPGLGEVGTDNYYATDQFAIDFPQPFFKNLYTWNDDLYSDQVLRPNDWGFAYKSIFYANVVLDGIPGISVNPQNLDKLNNLRGSALFYRAHCFYQLAQIFAPHYDETTAASDLGIPLKKTSDISEAVTRATVKETYNQIINDLEEAIPLLPALGAAMTRPSRAGVYALLARIYQTMGKHEKALSNANNCLQLKDTLLDFNPPGIPNPNRSYPMPLPANNPEIIFYARLIELNMYPMSHYYARVDSTLLNSYDDNDLRKIIYFRDAAPVFGFPGDNGKYFKGSYDRSEKQFGGLATDELYLIRAESLARLGSVDEAMTTLNTLLKKRWKNTVTFVPLIATTQEEALDIVLTERRKELLFRGTRWTDLRRLNKEGANITVTHILNNQAYTLEPGSKHYTYLIPTDVMQFNPGWQQNSR